MKLYYYGFIMIIKKFIFRKNTGEVIRWFASKMGVAYIKFAQMLAMQNYGNIFTEEDRLILSKICDNCNPIEFKKIVKIIEKEYGCSINDKFKKVYEEPVGSASISQVHKAILKNGDVVAIKVKRKDITRKIEKDIKQMKKIVHRFGRFAKFNNYLGGDTALNMYIDWIKEETDFVNEKNNILKYYHFSKSVNGKVENTVNIVTPRVYKKLCTDNIIVMEFINSKTINQMKLTKKNKEKISRCLDSYLKLSFHGLFYGKTVTFHGDPHGGNIYIDKNGNVGFLDMGLIFEIQGEEMEFIRKLFFLSYNNSYNELTKLILDNSECKSVDIDGLTLKIKDCCDNFKNIPVTQFFVKMINIFTNYEVAPASILFKMAKAFVSLYGINNFIDNKIDTEELLFPQLTEYYVSRTINNFKDIVYAGSKILPNFIGTTLESGIIKGISNQVIALENLNKKVIKSLNDFDEVIGFFK